jgi:hypothetical protein
MLGSALQGIPPFPARLGRLDPDVSGSGVKRTTKRRAAFGREAAPGVNPWRMAG